LFVLDANVFISAYRSYYSFDIVPSFWSNLLTLADQAEICSVDKIQQEIVNPREKKPDQLHEWSSNNFGKYFNRTDAQAVFNNYGKIQQWANDSDHFTDAAKDEFARNADSWLIAYAMANNCTIVTHETYRPDAKRRIFIPVVCEAFKVDYMDTFEMLRKLKVKF